MGETVEYSPSMESEIREFLPDDMVDVDVDVNVRGTWKHQLSLSLASEADRVLVEFPQFGTLFVKEFMLALNNEAQRFVEKFLTKIHSRITTSRETAIGTILSGRYPLDARMKMLDFFDRQKYWRISELALEFDVKDRKRPNKGKCGPENPLEIGEELHHIDWEKL